MNFHMASRGVAFNFDFPVGGHVYTVPIKSLKTFLACFAREIFLKFKLLYLTFIMLILTENSLIN